MNTASVQFNFSGKNILVTGGTRGIGKALVRLFHDAGATVHFQYNTSERAAINTVQEYAEKRIFAYQADFSNTNSIENLVFRIFENTPTVDILVNNAGIYHLKPITKTPFETWKSDWKETLNVNLNSPAFLSFLIAQSMQEQGAGKIINVSSRGAYRGEPEALAYGASKAGLISLSQSMAVALAPYGIKVYAVAPGFVHTEMSDYAMKTTDAEKILSQSPLHRIAQPEEIARTIAFLAADGHDYLTGSVIHINGASYLH